MAPKRQYYSVQELADLTALTPHPSRRNGLDAHLLPKLKALKVGRRYGGKMYPWVLTRHEVTFVLRFLVYRGWMKEKGLIHKFAPYAQEDITESVMIARAIEGKNSHKIVFPHEREGMVYAIRTAQEAIDKYDIIQPPQESEK